MAFNTAASWRYDRSGGRAIGLSPKNSPKKKFFLPPSIPTRVFAWVIERERHTARTVENSGGQKADAAQSSRRKKL
jgi:hypothetical protein